MHLEKGQFYKTLNMKKKNSIIQSALQIFSYTTFFMVNVDVLFKKFSMIRNERLAIELLTRRILFVKQGMKYL